MNKTWIIFVILLISASALIGKTGTENFRFKDHKVLLVLDNIKVDNVVFYSGKDVSVKFGKEDVIFNQEDNKLIITSPKKKATLSFMFPADKTYQFSNEEGVIDFDRQGVTFTGTDGSKILLDGKTITIKSTDNEIIVTSDGILYINSDDGDKLTINSDGIITEKSSDYEEDKYLTNFWGRSVAALIGVTMRTVMKAVGNTPEEVIAFSMNKLEFKNQVNVVISTVDSNAPDFGKKDKLREIEKSFSAARLKTLSIDNFNGKIDILPAKENILKINITISATNESELDKVEIEFKEDSDFVINSVPLTDKVNCSIKYLIELPSGIELKKLVTTNGGISCVNCRGDAEIITSNGSIDIIDHTGSVVLRTSNSSVMAESIAGGADIRTSNGKISADSITGEVYALTNNGKIDIKNCPVIRKAETSNGSIDLEIITLGNDLLVHTINSKINVILASSLDCMIEARTSNGSINLHNLYLTVHKSSSDYLSATYNDGGKLLEVETSNSSIHFYEKYIN
jgi:hypothetical protein